MTCRRLYGYILAKGFSLLRERLYARDPSINLREMRLFEGERILMNGRTLLRFPRPRVCRFAIYLLGNELPALEDDRAIFLSRIILRLIELQVNYSTKKLQKPVLLFLED